MIEPLGLRVKEPPPKRPPPFAEQAPPPPAPLKAAPQLKAAPPVMNEPPPLKAPLEKAPPAALQWTFTAMDCVEHVSPGQVSGCGPCRRARVQVAAHAGVAAKCAQLSKAPASSQEALATSQATPIIQVYDTLAGTFHQRWLTW